MSHDLPQLIEDNFKNYLHKSLQTSHNIRLSFYYNVLNISVFFIFSGLLGITLYICYTNKLSPIEKNNKRIRDEAEILSKVRFYQQQSRMDASQKTRITDLPTGTAPEFREMFEL